MTGPRIQLPGVSKDDLSGRCTARLRFPCTPYHNLRCGRHPHDSGLHTLNTKVPTEYVPETARQWRKPEMVTVTLTWEGPA